MRLTSAQTDRACGVLLASALGDALGAGYEFQPGRPDLVPELVGDHRFGPGEWTDDTAQAMAIARVAAQGTDLRTTAGLDAVAAGFLEWLADGPADIGIQTSGVLGRLGRDATAAEMAEAARAVHERSGRSAGNGSLMRTGPVALAYLDDPAALVEAAQAVSALTHHDELAGQGCALWCLMIRHAVLSGEFPAYDDVAPWMPEAEGWRGILHEAETSDPSGFTDNGWVVGALQAAWSAIVHTPVPTDRPACEHLVDGLTTAIRIGSDTDTVAAIAAALLGARWGLSAVPLRWKRQLHGWPRATARELEALAVLTVHGGAPGAYGWPKAERIDYSDFPGTPALARHPDNDGVWIAGVDALDRLPDGVDEVVSLCLTGSAQVPEGTGQVSVRLIDSADPAENPHLDFVLEDTARYLADLRSQGHTVLVHCVQAQSRTPAVAAAYSLLLGRPLDEALTSVSAVLPAAHPNDAFREALARLARRS